MRAQTAINDNLISPEADELAALRDALRILDDVPDDMVQIGGRNGQSIVLPVSAVRALRRVIDLLSHDEAVSVSKVGQRLTLDQVARLLNLPLSHVVRIIDSGELTVRRDEGVESVSLDNLLAFVHARAVQRHEALNELSSLSEELGLYDLEE